MTVHLSLETKTEVVLFLSGGSSLLAEKLQDCVSRAVTRNREIKKLIDKVTDSMKSSK